MTPDQIAKAPHLEIGNDLVDFGTIKGNTAVSKSVSLTNTGVSNLQIRKVNNRIASCFGISPADEYTVRKIDRYENNGEAFEISQPLIEPSHFHYY